MKKQNWLMLLFVLMMIFVSCDDDKALDALLSGDDGTTETIDPEEPDPDDPYNVITDAVDIPCDYDFTTTEVKASLNIACDYDLQGKTINFPEGVKLNFNGGKIVNGKLNFSNEGVIDGQLLNINLQVEGGVAIEHPHFIFEPSRWDMVQGETSDENAFINKENLNLSLEVTHNLGAEVFEIDQLDAYFFGKRYTKHPPISYEHNGIKIPSNTHFLMSDNTFLRVQPTNNPFTRLLMTFKAKDVIIEGGNLVGDRYTHDYANVVDEEGVSRNEHGYGALVMILGSHNVTVDNVNAYEDQGDGIAVQGSSIRNRDGSLKEGAMQSENVVIKNSFIDKCRRNNFSITDGEGIVIEGCTISNAGGEHDSGERYEGTAPEIGIDLEAYRERKEDGSLYAYERVAEVTIRNNTFKGNYVADVLVFTADFVTIENNEMDNRVGVNAGHDVKILNNNLTAKADIKTNVAIGFDNYTVAGEELTYNIEASGNTISGYDTSMRIGTSNVKVADNNFNDFKEAIYISDIEDAEISNNTFKSDRDVSYAYFSRGNVVAKNVMVKGEQIEVTHRPLYLTNLNDELNNATDRIVFDDCYFASSRELYLYECKNITIKNSSLNTRIEQVNSENIVLQNNETR
ncbi:right-handed parallel beta-helix repeat-containing protein [Galbibacter sp. BG1]|uniref:right-handed parallel beta-helix repeat-containing protein n=1 Tax=Galbibacter sp. BG1 TaxID=1170699 RepID=UPI0015BF5821|nr:right-handed parallel beta-helix repeat-containing protein [Galbibacter sp. BG1]QLE02509.1 right-handed parallel beta-helix repeat-containing protein [Galbibacter sp. BG1]